MTRKMFSLLIFSLSYLEILDAATDTIKPGHSIAWSETIISAGGKFELGFFTPGNSTNYFVGIWYKKIPVPTVVWVANRDYPLTTPSGTLTINRDGDLVILDGKITYSVSELSSIKNSTTSATLLDSGNLVLRDSNSDVLWQSFDSPSDTFLPGMKIGNNRKTGKAWTLTSWRSEEDPAPGAFSLKMDPANSSQFFIMQGSKMYWTSGVWNGQIFSLIPEMRLNYIFNFSYVTNQNESYFTYDLYNTSIISRCVLDLTGQIKQLSWLEEWNLFWAQPRPRCNVYAICRAFGRCSEDSLPLCECLPGFEPRSSSDWNLSDWSGGCKRITRLQCGINTSINAQKDMFLLRPNMRLPLMPQPLAVGSGADCELACLNNCSCTAYAYGGGGCSIWVGDLLNLQQFSDDEKAEGHHDLYLRLAASDYLEISRSRGNKRKLWAIVAPVVALTVLLLASFIWCKWMRKLKQKGEVGIGHDLLLFDMGISIAATQNEACDENKIGNVNKDAEFPLFSFASVSATTDNFSVANKLGEGGFGPVYKGKLLKGQEIAVKRLSARSGQGLEELKNETTLIAKLQHRNLVRILGCCIEGDEKILIYEYMPNKSLDNFLFDTTKRGLLDWEIRVRIIEGIAQGLLYLHQYSRLRIIHRDLKASNILLDSDMNPKISDFGMARIFGGSDSQANTNRIVGTHGYMSPEYVMEGTFSIKSDVFSFGVLLLEILSGKKNTGFYNSDSLNLLTYAWDLWKGDRALELMDPILRFPSSTTSMLLRYINLGLLCVQEYAADRPTMSDVVSVLGNELSPLPTPKQPAFSSGRSVIDANSHMNRLGACSVNEAWRLWSESDGSTQKESVSEI